MRTAWRFRAAIRSERCHVRHGTAPEFAGAVPRLHASLVTDSLPVQLGLDEADVKLVEGSAGAHG